MGFFKQKKVTVPQLILIAGTRVALGAGLGLLLSEKLNKDERKGAGWALVVLGAATTVPLALGLILKD
jgi:hypothetical protein